eukprot:TRINITY_DN19790_c0_g1_i1.p1 TRINITY_DN19790_c0_g1~~TRINITY_DN19790_c0_g1_i1.p1  ORF type:complete len:193 (+),score=44.64 TRINITY_DN19790_c0_g1_i1:50-628(+)
MSGGDVASVKRNVEGWREMVILADTVLSWEKDWYAAVTSGTLSVLFLFVWNQDPTMVTLLALLGLVVTILDFAIPRLQDKFFPGPDSWTAEKEKRLELICQEVVFVQTGISRLMERLSGFKESSPVMYMTGVTISLYIIAYIGTVFSGIFLSYLILLIALMMPGLHRRGLLKKYCASTILKIGEFVKAKKLE